MTCTLAREILGIPEHGEAILRRRIARENEELEEELSKFVPPKCDENRPGLYIIPQGRPTTEEEREENRRILHFAQVEDALMTNNFILGCLDRKWTLLSHWP